MTSRLAIPLIGLVLVSALTIWRPVAGDVDLRVYDALARGTPPPDTPPRVVIAAIDEASLAAFGQWPWRRDTVARLVERLAEMGAASIAFDVLFAEPDRAEAAAPGTADARLAEAFARAPVAASFAFVFGGSRASDACEVHPLRLAQRQQGERLPTGALPEASGIVCTLGALTSAAGASGHINAVPDSDGLLRRIPLLIAYDGGVYPSLALAAVRRAEPDSTLILERRADDGLRLVMDGRAIGLDEQGRILLGSHGPAPVIPVADIMDGRAAPDAVRGRIVFVGATALGLQDLVATPFGSSVPGVALHAALAESLLGGALYERPEFARLLELGASLFAGLVVILLARRAGLAAAGLAALAMAMAAWWSSGWLLAERGRYLSPLYPALAVTIVLGLEGVTALAGERRRANRERRRRGDAQRLLVQALTSLTETRDENTGLHARRTQEYTRILATAVAGRPAYRRLLTTEQVALISTLAPLHDIGKVGISDAVLRKPGSLTASERDEMRRHPGLGHESLLKAEALAGVHDDEVVTLAKEIVHTHHEFWDGTGYPNGLRGTEIPLSGRIVALVDVYDAMVAERAYRKAMVPAEAAAAIIAARGQHFDPEIVDAFETVQDRFAQVARRPQL